MISKTSPATGAKLVSSLAAFGKNQIADHSDHLQNREFHDLTAHAWCGDLEVQANQETHQTEPA